MKLPDSLSRMAIIEKIETYDIRFARATPKFAGNT
jgi:hypothetical protein